jgi:heme-degrading monooxygenase HmoA
MYTVINRIQVPGTGTAGFEEHFAGSMHATLADVDGLVGARLLRPEREGGAYLAIMDFTSRDAFLGWMRSPAFRAAHGPETRGMSGDVESFEAVASVGYGDGETA